MGSIIHFMCTSLAFLMVAIVESAQWNNVQNSAVGKALNMATLKGDLGLEVGNDLKQIRQFQTASGKQKIKFQQTYKNVDIFDAVIVAEKRGNGFNGWARGQLATDISADLQGNVQPQISFTDALNACKEKNHHIGLAVENINIILTIHTDPEVDNSIAHLAYYVSYLLNSDNNVTRPFSFVDALNGKILRTWEGLNGPRGGNGKGSGHGPPGGGDGGGSETPGTIEGDGGNQKIGLHRYGTDGAFPALNILTDGTNCKYLTDQVMTVHMGFQTTASDVPAVVDCNSGASDAINGGYSPLNDAHFYGQKVFEAFKAYVGQSPLTALPLILRVHYSAGYENAFWDGRRMTFGDGQSTFYPLTGLDVVGHEVAHGFTEQNSGLVYQNQYGGMNEAFSDIAGEAVEYFTKSSNDFLLGSDIFKSSTGTLRYMCNPTQDGRSIDHANQYYDGLDVHFSSGVYNKAFCLLATTPEWNTQKAFLVFARANQNYWSAYTQFNAGACGVENAATDEGLPIADVTAAFAKVGVCCEGCL